MFRPLLGLLSFIVPILGAKPPTHASGSRVGAYATYYNNVRDLLDGQDGIPLHPADYQDSGKLAVAVDVDGNAMEQAEAHISYYEGRYYLYSATWSCGKFVYGTVPGFGNINATQQGSAPNPIQSRGHLCPDDLWHQVRTPMCLDQDGHPVNIRVTRTYSSPDMTSWKLVDFYVPSDPTTTPTKPVVRYSNMTNTYVMLLGNQALTDLYYLVSKSPSGPFCGPQGEAPGILSGPNIGHDFDIAEGSDGTNWILTDTFGTGVNLPPDGSNPYITTVGITWDVVVQKLNPDLVSLPNRSAETFKVIFTARELADKGLSMEASSFFYRDGYYYMLFAQTCQNCAGMTYYFYSKGNPLGPYTDGGILRADGCGAQNKGANVLPVGSGLQGQNEVLVLNAALAYRTNPTSWTLNGVVGHANNNQALSHTFYWPLAFNADHTIKPFTCPPEVQIPLAANASRSSPSRPVQRQFDCRIRNWQSIELDFNPPRQRTTRNISLAMFQRNDDVTAVYTPSIIDGPLTIKLQYDDQTSSSHVFSPLELSWAATRINISTVGGPDRRVSRMHMSTNATTGCFGYIVEPRNDDSSSGGNSSMMYSVDVYGHRKLTPSAQIYLYSF